MPRQYGKCSRDLKTKLEYKFVCHIIINHPLIESAVIQRPLVVHVHYRLLVQMLTVDTCKGIGQLR